MRREIRPFDASEYLDSEEMIAEYLSAAIEEGPDVFLLALGDIAKAVGVAEVAQRTGLGRESLYKSLAPGSKPRYETVWKLIQAFGLKLKFEPMHG